MRAENAAFDKYKHEPLADAYLFYMNREELAELAEVLGLPPLTLINRAARARYERYLLRVQYESKMAVAALTR